MPERKTRKYTKLLKDLVQKKSTVLLKAQSLAKMGMVEAAEPVWACAAAYEERIAPLLDAMGRDLEAALHRVSAASCYQKAGERTRAANLFQAALAGPLAAQTRKEVQDMLEHCLGHLLTASNN